MQRASDTAARGLGVAIETWAERAARTGSAPLGAPAAPVPPVSPVPPRPAVEAPGFAGPAPRQSPAPAVPEAHADAPPDSRAGLRPESPPDPGIRLEAPFVARSAPQPDADATIPQTRDAAMEAEWLAACLRSDAAQRAAPAWTSMWKRRLVTWSIAGGLLAGLAAGGLWLYEENRVDGALVVVAETTPAGAAPAPAPHGTPAFTAPDTPRPAPAAATAPVPPPAAPDIVRPPPDLIAATPAVSVPPAAPASPASDASDERTVKTVDMATARDPDIEPPKRTPRQAATARKRPAAKTHRARAQDTPPPAKVAAEPSPRQRREETLMQCRAHGYDERQCFQRACTMTRYGLVCRG